MIQVPGAWNKLTILDGSNFVISGYDGDIVDGVHGFFVSDTRYISKLILTVNGAPMRVLTSKIIDYYSCGFYLRSIDLLGEGEKPGEVRNPASVMVERKRSVSDVFYEEDTFRNFSEKNLRVQIGVEVGVDFADIFDVKSITFKARDLVFQMGIPGRVISKEYIPKENAFSFNYVSEDQKFTASTLFWFSERGMVDEKGTRMSYDVTLEPRGSWKLVVDAVPIRNHEQRRQRYSNAFFGNQRRKVVESFQKWHLSVPHLITNLDNLRHLYQQSFVDIASLRINDPDHPEYELPAAGMPWFMTIFGRDTLITSYETILFGINLYTGALRSLSALQSTKFDDEHDSEPGKIVHEMRFGETGERSGQFPYYGSADSTLLFLILASEAYRWTAQTDFLEELKPNLLNALRWIRDFGDIDGDGFIDYKRRSKNGLENQCWKDSWNSILFKNGELAEPPIATCEIQGYAYLAMSRFAEIARNVWKDESLSNDLLKASSEMKKKFNEDFWIDEGGYYALALDGHKNKVDSLTSNIGHLLWSEIIDDRDGKVEEVTRRLMSEEMFNGWGVRTMSSKDLGFDPIGYHIGTVWPHDNALIAEGLAKYGKKEEAMRIIFGMIEAGVYFDHRMPEVFAGIDRSESSFPVQFPTASSPQAWAAGATVSFLRTVLGIEPDLVNKTLRANPIVPKDFGYKIDLFDVSAFGKRFHVSLEGGNVARVTEEEKSS